MVTSLTKPCAWSRLASSDARPQSRHAPSVYRGQVSVQPITFRPLLREDFSLLAGWLAEPLVARWWNHQTSPEALDRDFGPSVDGRDATDIFVAVTDHSPFGLIQRYAIDAYPEYLEELSPVCTVPPGALSVDYLIGKPQARGQGLGAAMIAILVADSWRGCPDAHDVIVPVCAANVGSWRALERAGFTRIAAGQMEPDNPVDSRDHFVYRIERPAAAVSAAARR